MDDKQLVRLDFKPGLESNQTQYAAEGAWFDGDKVRFYQGKPETIGGWINVHGAGASTAFDGIARGIHTWTDNVGVNYVAIGTHRRLYVWDKSSNFIDITPIRANTALTDNFNTSTGSAEVLITATGHGGNNGDIIAIVSASISIGNTIILSSVGTTVEYTAIVSDANTVRLSVVSAATSTLVQGGSTAQLIWYLPVGRLNNTPGTGWGGGAWGVSTWGTARSSGVLQILRTWSLDSWGQTLVASPRGGALYHWGINTNTRASVITAAPSIIDFMIVSPEDQHIICLGTHDEAGAYNPMIVRWNSQGNLTDWTASATNTAGTKTLSGKGKLISGIKARNQILLFTDNSLYSMAHQGALVGNTAISLTFDFSFLGGNCGIVAPHAAVLADGRVFWMSHNQFFVYDGAIIPIPCPVRDKVFDIIDHQQMTKTFAGQIAKFNEVIWFFQSMSSTEIDRYVAFNYMENTWSYGTLTRTAWIDQDNFDNPMGTGTDSKLYYHETGVSADGGALANYVESGYIDLGDGTDLLFVDKFLPDFNVSIGNIGVSFKFSKFPNQTPVEKGPVNVGNTTKQKGVRGRGRQMAIRVSSNNHWRYGSPRVRVKPDGEH